MGSAFMSIPLSAGGFPSKVMVPVTVEAARATPGQTDAATSTAASHNLFPVARMLDIFVIVPYLLRVLGKFYTGRGTRQHPRW
jgi:hypothetical protein